MLYKLQNSPTTFHPNTAMGNFNIAPKGWKKITKKEFIDSQFNRTEPEYLEIRQLVKDIYGKVFPQMIRATLFFYTDQTGLGIGNNYHIPNGKVEFYRFGCKHHFVEIEQGRGFVKLQCTLCDLKKIEPNGK